MVGRLDDIVDIHHLVRYVYSVGLEDIPCLLPVQAATFDMVRVISHVYLRTMVYATLHLRLPLFTKGRQ